MTVNYTTQYQLTTGAPNTGGIVVLATTPNSYGVVSPSGTSAPDGWYNAGTSMWLTGLPTIAGWGFIDLSNQYRQQEVVMNSPTTVTANFAPRIVAQPAFSPIVVPAGGSTTVRFTVANGGSGQSQSALRGGAAPNIRQLIGSKGKRQHPRDDPYENTGCYSDGDALGASIIQAIQYDSYAAFWATFSAESQVPSGGPFDVTCSCQYYGCSIDLGPNYGGPPADSVVITGVSPEPPWQAGSTVNFAITGTGFGSSPTLNILWADGTSYNTSCSGSPCTGTTTVPSDAAGQAMATVSATYSGLGLLGGSSGEVGSDPFEIDVAAPTITISTSNPLWYFGGYRPPPVFRASGLGDIQTTLTAAGMPSEGGSFSWSITAGTTKASFSSSGTYTLVSTTDVPSVVLYSASWSTAENDVTVSLVWTDANGNPYPAITLQLSIDSPYQLVPNGANTYGVAANGCPSPTNPTGISGTAGYLTQVSYIAQSFFGVNIGNQYVNEQLGNPQNVLTNNWGPLPTPSSTLSNTGGGFNDTICFSATGASPLETQPATPLGATLVEFAAQTWSLGVMTIGAGVPVQTDTIQYFIDHGAHAGIVTPLRGIGQ